MTRRQGQLNRHARTNVARHCISHTRQLMETLQQSVQRLRFKYRTACCSHSKRNWTLFHNWILVDTAATHVGRLRCQYRFAMRDEVLKHKQHSRDGNDTYNASHFHRLSAECLDITTSAAEWTTIDDSRSFIRVATIEWKLQLSRPDVRRLNNQPPGLVPKIRRTMVVTR